MTRSSRVCHEHFKIDDFELYYETKMPDGTVSRIKRGRAKLKDDAVPSIFPEYPTYYQPKVTKRKQPTLRGSPRKKKPPPVVKDIITPDIIVTAPEPERNEEVQEKVSEEAPVVNTEENPVPENHSWHCQDVVKLTLPRHWVLDNDMEKDRRFVVQMEPGANSIHKTMEFVEKETPKLRLMGRTTRWKSLKILIL